MGITVKILRCSGKRDHEVRFDTFDVPLQDNSNVLDVVTLVSCVLSGSCGENDCSGDLNFDFTYNILDIVILVNCILANNCDE